MTVIGDASPNSPPTQGSHNALSAFACILSDQAVDVDAWRPVRDAIGLLIAAKRADA